MTNNRVALRVSVESSNTTGAGLERGVRPGRNLIEDINPQDFVELLRLIPTNAN
jgi:hypothetical protein